MIKNIPSLLIYHYYYKEITIEANVVEELFFAGLSVRKQYKDQELELFWIQM